MSDGHKKRFRIDELAARASVLLTEAEVDQESGRVSSAPSPRTIRYYASHGLLDPPAEYEGRAALYDRRHLLQLVAIKRLQAKGLSLSEVQGQIAGCDEEKLEELAGLARDAFGRAAQEAWVDRRTAATADSDAPEPESEGADQDDFWRRSPAETGTSPERASAADVDTAAAEPRPSSRPSSGASEAFGGVWIDDDVGLLLSELRRPVESDDLAAIRAAAAPLLKVLRKRNLIDNE